MSSYTLSPVWGAGAQLFDNNGDPLSGGKIFTYQAGTTTPAVTYTNPIGTVANTNPIIADSAGRLNNEIWLPIAGAYKFVLKNSNDVLLATYDNIPTFAQPPIANDATSISYEQGYTVTAGAFTVGATYLITTVGTTDFVAIGAAGNVTNILFTATGVGSGTGTARYSRTLQIKLRETISVKDFGAVGDGVTNDRNALQASIDYATENNVALYIPSGTYYVPNNSTSLTFTGNLTMYGDGMYNTILYYDDSVSTSRRDFIKTALAGNINFKDLCLSCDWGSNGSYAERSQMTEIASDNTGNAIITRCRFTNSRFMSLALNKFNSATITECVFNDGVADGCRVTDSQNVIVSNNQFSNINDDSVAVHTKDSAGFPAKSNIVVANNNMVDSQGIAVLGGKHVTISGNVVTRPITRGIFVGQSNLLTTEGATSVAAVSITGNTITDVFKGSTFSAVSGDNGGYIQIAGFELSNNGTGFVTYGDGSGGVVEPYPYLYQNNLGVATKNAGNWFANIVGNTCARTLGPVTNYSDYGYGVRLARTGPVDPFIGYSAFDANQVLITNYANSLNISDNVISGGITHGINLRITTTQSVNSRENVNISNNIITDISHASVNSGIFATGYGIIKIDGNIFNIDPYNVQSQRLPNGKWNSSYMQCTCIWIDDGNMVVTNNTFKNAGTIFRGATFSDHIWKNNIVECNPVSIGTNANNQGIRDLSRVPNYDGFFVICDSDPSSPTFNTVLNVCAVALGDIPTTGKYVQDLFVKKNAYVILGSIGSKYILTGWARLTTGSNHVLGTDWAEIRTLTGS